MAIDASESKQDYATRRYAEIAEDYVKRYSLKDITFFGSHVDSFLALLRPGMSILDAGCGVGQWTDYLLKRGFRVTSVDSSKEMLMAARREFSAGNFMKMDIRSLRFDDESFDGILAALVLIHFDKTDIPQVIREFKRLLRRNGAICISVWDIDPLKTNLKKVALPETFLSETEMYNYLKSEEFKVVSNRTYTSPYEEYDRIVFTIGKRL